MDRSWIVRLTPAVSAPRLRILCLPFAGAGAGAYRAWTQHLPADVDLLALRLPGRESRFGEPMVSSLDVVVAAALAELPEAGDVPVALFGHSMGATIAHDLALAMTAAGVSPAAVMVSGRVAPFLPSRRAIPMGDLPDAAFLEALRGLGGMPPELLDHPDIMTLLLPVLRADVRMAEQVRRPRRAVLDCPVAAVAGTEDTAAPPADVAAWGEMCRGAFVFRSYPGGHFFIRDAAPDLLALLMEQAGLR